FQSRTRRSDHQYLTGVNAPIKQPRSSHPFVLGFATTRAPGATKLLLCRGPCRVGGATAKPTLRPVWRKIRNSKFEIRNKHKIQNSKPRFRMRERPFLSSA